MFDASQQIAAVGVRMPSQFDDVAGRKCPAIGAALDPQALRMLLLQADTRAALVLLEDFLHVAGAFAAILVDAVEILRVAADRFIALEAIARSEERRVGK